MTFRQQVEEIVNTAYDGADLHNRLVELLETPDTPETGKAQEQAIIDAIWVGENSDWIGARSKDMIRSAVRAALQAPPAPSAVEALGFKCTLDKVAKVAAESQPSPDPASENGSIHPFFVDVDLNDSGAIDAKLLEHFYKGRKLGREECKKGLF